jgi:cholesterol oxidase
MLTHGLGVSSLIFSIDTIETNLLEYLFEAGYDVWLLDYRVSIELNSCWEKFTGDEVALYDYPAAVEHIRRNVNCDDILVVAHCFGATTFTMAMLAGLQGVRAAVLSQICTDVVAARLTRLKASLHLEDVIKAMGIDSLTAYADKNRGWVDALYDNFLKLYPIEKDEQANSAVHRRITFLYGTLYELDNLNDATFRALHEMFGTANIAAFDHLAEMVRQGKVVDKEGGDTYLPHIRKFDVPTRIIHGAENACFAPISTEKSLERLARANGAKSLSRVVIPDYGHIDCVFGKNAARDVYPRIQEHLDTYARA